jgi:hypothetical protein
VVYYERKIEALTPWVISATDREVLKKFTSGQYIQRREQRFLFLYLSINWTRNLEEAVHGVM